MAETEIELNIDIKKFDLLPRLILDGRSQGHRADICQCVLDLTVLSIHL